MKMKISSCIYAAVLFSSALNVSGASAQSEGEFFKNKQVKLIVGFAAGNEYDIGAR